MHPKFTVVKDSDKNGKFYTIIDRYENRRTGFQTSDRDYAWQICHQWNREFLLRAGGRQTATSA